MVPGRLVRTRMRSAALTASERSWVIRIAVLRLSRMMVLISSQTVIHYLIECFSVMSKHNCSMMQMILLEQIYRSYRIMNHEPYHK